MVGPDVDQGPGPQEDVEGGEVGVGDGEVEGRLALVVDDVGVGASPDQQ